MYKSTERAWRKKEEYKICCANDRIIELHNEKLDRIISAINLKEPDRVPIVPFIDHPGYWPRHTGMSLREFMFDFRKSRKAVISAINDLHPDAHTAYYLPLTGQLIQQLKLAEDFISIPSEDKPSSYGIWQWNSFSRELVSAENYDVACKEPLWYARNRIFPELMGVLEGSPQELRLAIQRIMSDSRKIKDLWGEIDLRCGTPLFSSGIGLGPVELGVFLRGAKNFLVDVRKNPEKLKNLTSAFASYVPVVGSLFKEFSGTPVSLLMLSYTMNEFLSKKSLDDLFWPILKAQINEMMHSSLVPMLFYEGNIESFLDHHLELPRAGCILWAGMMNAYRVKETVGDHQCIYGGLPYDLLVKGSPNMVEKKVKELCEQCKDGGGFMIGTEMSIQRDVKPENLKAMIGSTEKYGRYR